MSDIDKHRAEKHRVDYRDVCWTCDLGSLSFDSTEELDPLDRFIGQDRAQESIRFALEVDKPGYNLFVTGLTGTGKTAAVQYHLTGILDDPQWAEKRKPNYDWVYIHNFDDLDRPHAVRLPRGTGRTYRQALTSLLGLLKEQVTKTLASEELEAQRRARTYRDSQAIKAVMGELEEKGRAASFAVQLTASGVALSPMNEGRLMTPEEYQGLDQSDRQAIDNSRAQLAGMAQETMAVVKEIETAAAEEVRMLERGAAAQLVSSLLSQVAPMAQNTPEMDRYFSGLTGYILDHINLFRAGASQIPGPLVPGLPPATAVADGPALVLNPFLPFEINVFVDNTAADRPPIIVEPHPTWGNLFGRIERRAVMGSSVSDHAVLKAGSVHLANGGYLVLSAKEVLTAPGAWEGLKRAIRDRQALLEDPGEQAGLVTPQGLRPEPIPLDLKVIMTGDERTYRVLTAADNEDFWDLFKVKAEFDTKVDRTEENLAAYCAFICSTCIQERLTPFENAAAARVLEYASRLVGDQNKLSTRFGLIKDLLIEADYWARKKGGRRVREEDIRQALAHKVYRLNLVEERIREMIADGSLLLDLTGEAVGQVNGLAVYDLGDFSFGRPSRITAQTFAGREGVINIEREALLSGRTHDKGVLILSGYLGANFAQDSPLTLSASLCFEQSYDGVDGDSASSAEIYAILSSLAGLPLRQDVAVTGSVNQRGGIQPIGGVNEKIEGMFDVCRAAGGLTGTQGVVIPDQNVRNLMLREDVVEAIRNEQFGVYGVRTIDEGLEILTGVEAGAKRPDGSYPEGTVNHRVAQRLRELNDSMRAYYERTPAERSPARG